MTRQTVGQTAIGRTRYWRHEANRISFTNCAARRNRGAVIGAQANSALGDPGFVLAQSDSKRAAAALPAIEVNRRVIEMDPLFFPARVRLGILYVVQGRYDDGIAELEKARKLDDGTWSISSLGYGYARAGRPAEARRVLEELRALSRSRYVPPYDIAGVYAALGETDRVFEWLERMYQETSVNMPWIKVDYYSSGVRSDPRFQELLRRMNL